MILKVICFLIFKFDLLNIILLRIITMSNHIHNDGWESDDIFRSMRRNCEEYKKIKKENEYLKDKNKELYEKIQSFENKKKIGNPKWNDVVLSICKDGKQRTSREIYLLIKSMDLKPWAEDAKTPTATCSATCGNLFGKGILYKTNDEPIKYFMLIK